MLNPTIAIPQTFKVTQEQFQQIAFTNRELRLERKATGELIVMPPTGSETGNRNLDIEGQIWLWNRQPVWSASRTSSGWSLDLSKTSVMNRGDYLFLHWNNCYF